MLPCLSQLVCVGGFSMACLRTDVILHVLSEKCGFLSSSSGAQWKKPIFFRPSLAAVIVSGRLPHVIQKLGLIPGQHAECLPTESWLSAETNPNYCPTFLKKMQPFRSNRDLPTQTKSLQQINSHLFITEYLPPCSTVKSWNIFHLGKLPGAVLPRKANTHIPVSLMPQGPPLPICALFYKT